MKAKFEIEILEDGSVKIITESFPDGIHAEADDIVSMLEEEIGGEVEKEKNPNNPGTVFWKNKTVRRGGKIAKAGS